MLLSLFERVHESGKVLTFSCDQAAMPFRHVRSPKLKQHWRKTRYVALTTAHLNLRLTARAHKRCMVQLRVGAASRMPSQPLQQVQLKSLHPMPGPFLRSLENRFRNLHHVLRFGFNRSAKPSQSDMLSGDEALHETVHQCTQNSPWGSDQLPQCLGECLQIWAAACTF